MAGSKRYIDTAPASEDVAGVEIEVATFGAKGRRVGDLVGKKKSVPVGDQVQLKRVHVDKESGFILYTVVGMPPSPPSDTKLKFIETAKSLTVEERAELAREARLRVLEEPH